MTYSPILAAARRSRRLRLVPCALVSVFISAFAQVSLDQLVQDAERRLDAAASARNEDSLLAVRRVFEQCVHQDAGESRCYYDLGFADASLFQANDFRHDRKSAQRWLDSAIENTRRSLHLDEHRADAHALLAGLYGSKIAYGGMLAGMRYGLMSEAETRRALALDPGNAQAYAVLGRRYLYSPAIFGGDIDKAIDLFHKATILAPHNDGGFVWLAIAYRKKGDRARAQAALAEALRLNAHSAFAKQVQSGAD